MSNEKTAGGSDLKRAFSDDGPLKTHVGGQALLEGIMMRGKFNWAVAVRTPDGDIYTEEHDLASGKDKNAWMYWPIIRGCRAFVESLALAYKALEIAALHAFNDEMPEDEEEPENAAPVGASDDAAAELASEEAVLDEVLDPVDEPEPEPHTFSWKDDFGRPDTMIDALGAQRTLEVVTDPEPMAVASEAEAEPQSIVSAAGAAVDFSGDDEPAGEEVFGKREMAISMALGLVLGVVLFVVAPALIANLIVGEYDAHTLAWNIIDGIVRVAVFVFYIWLIGRMEDIKRMFMYHGAEHKTIHCFEHGLPLTPENARSFPRLHVRCGTAFLIMVMIIAIIVYTLTPLNALISAWGVPDGAPKLILVIIVRILLMPLIAGISYEITVKWAGSHPDNWLVKIILWPGMQMQYLTTNEPDDEQIECAIAAMKLVLEREEREAAAASA